MEVDMQHVSIHGHDMVYRREGAGPALLLLHGIAGSSRTWRDVIPRLTDRRSTTHVILQVECHVRAVPVFNHPPILRAMHQLKAGRREKATVLDPKMGLNSKWLR